MPLYNLQSCKSRLSHVGTHIVELSTIQMHTVVWFYSYMHDDIDLQICICDKLVVVIFL